MAHVRCVFKRRHEDWRSKDDSVQVTHSKTPKLAWLSNCDFPEIEKSNASTVPWIACVYVLFRQLSVYIRYDLSRPINLLPLDREVRRSSSLSKDSLSLSLFDLRFCFIKFSLTGGQHTISTFHKGSTGGNAPWPRGRSNGELLWTNNRGSEHQVGYSR